MATKTKKPGRGRLDRALVERGLAKSRERALALILAGVVRVDGQPGGKPGTLVADDARVEVLSRDHPFVGRGGVKLEGALVAFAIDVRDRVVLDVGASTGGFTDCLLRRGARRVYALDVGRGQLDWSLRNDPRVVVLEGRNARYLAPGDLPEPVDLTVVDVSFISLGLVLAPLPALLRARGEVVALVKPQFEVGKGRVGAGGIVRDPALHLEALRSASGAAAAAGLNVRGVCRSTLPGAEGNREFFLHLARTDAGAFAGAALARLLEGVVHEG